MRFFLIFCFATILFSACSNFDTVEVRDEKNNIVLEHYTINKKTKKKEGAYTAFYPNGQKREESFFLNDSLHGEQKMYYENGQLESIANHANGMFIGKYQKFSEAGKLTNEGQYENNEMAGIWKKYDENGKVLEEVSFVANQENGPFKEYHPNGSVKTEGSYLNGPNENGELKIYDETGALVQRMFCEFGICAESWSKEKGDVPVDTAKVHNLAEMKKSAEQM